MYVSKLKVLILLIFLSTQVVDGLSQKIEIEILGGSCLTSLRGNESLKTYSEPAINLSTAAGLHYFLNRNIAITFKVLYERKGAKDASNIFFSAQRNQDLGYIETKSNLDYISIPLQCAYRFGKSVKYQFGAGFYSAYLLQHTLILSNDGNNQKFDQTHNGERIDFGLSGSFNVFIPLSEFINISLGLNENLGIYNISNPAIDDGKVMNNSLGVLAGLNFKIK